VPALEAVKWLRSNREFATTPIIILDGNAKTESLMGRDRVIEIPRPISAARILRAMDEALTGIPKPNGPNHEWQDCCFPASRGPALRRDERQPVRSRHCPRCSPCRHGRHPVLGDNRGSRRDAIRDVFGYVS